MLEHSLEMCRAGNFLFLIPGCASFLSVGYARTGRADEAVHLLEGVLNEAVAVGLSFYYASWTARLGEVYPSGLLTTHTSTPRSGSYAS